MQWPYASWGADAVISGHDHTYERIFADGIVYFVNGLGGHGTYGFITPVSGSQVRYNGNLYFCLTGDRDSISDPEFLIDCLVFDFISLLVNEGIFLRISVNRFSCSTIVVI